MTHMKTVDDAAGDFSDAKVSDRPCRKCKSANVSYRVWESSCGGYEDCKYTCSSCGAMWWVDGCDS